MHTVKSAERHNVTGWVRNLTDGDVEGEAQGDEETSLRSFLADVKKGPEMAEVKEIKVTDREVKSAEEGFRKIRWGESV